MNPVSQILLILIIWNSYFDLLASCNDNSKEVIENVNNLRNEISTKIQFLIDQLREREHELFQELNEFETNFQKEQEKRDDNIESLNNMQDTTESNVEGSEFVKSFRHQQLLNIDLKLNEIRFNSSKTFVTLSWNEDILHSVRNLGRIEIREKIRYQNKIYPILTASRKGHADGEMSYPRGIAIDAKSSNIFIADTWNHRVQVFDDKGQYLYKFGENGAGKLNFPWGIAIGNDKLYVSSQSGPKVYSYELNGNFVEEFENDELSQTTGIAVSENSGDIYVCDWNKNMVFVYSQDRKYKTSFGESNLYYPRDIKLTQDRIFVLDCGNPCIHIFNRDLSYSHSIVDTSTDGRFFTLDHEENILVSEYDRNVINVFNQRGELIHQIGNGSDIFYRPNGIAINSKNRIIVVDWKQGGMIKYF